MDLARELKRPWKRKITVVPIVVGAVETILKGFKKRRDKLKMKGKMEKIQVTILLTFHWVGLYNISF